MNAESSDLVLWDVVLEHLDEAAFGLEQLERAFEHPLWSLADVAGYPEARLLAHIDGLVVGGSAIMERVLLPALLEPEDDQPARITAAALVLLHLGERARLAPALAHEQRAVCGAVARACALASQPNLEAWAAAELRRASAPQHCAALLEVIAAGTSSPSPLLAWLQSDDAEVVLAAARAARRADARTHLPVIEYLLGHGDRAVREAALVTGLTWGSQTAWGACRSWALDASAPSVLALQLYAALGGRAEHARIARLLGSAEHARHALFALGLAGNIAHVPVLLEWLRGEDPLLAKMAAQSLSMITGIDLGDDAFAQPPQADEGDDDEADRALPALEQDDLEADLAPPPEDALPEIEPAAIERHWQDNGARFAPEQRYLAGEPLGLAVLLHELEHGPQRRRHALALALAIRTGGQVWLDTHAFTARQRAGVQTARGSGLRTLPSPFASF